MPKWSAGEIWDHYMDGETPLGTVQQMENGRWFWQRYWEPHGVGHAASKEEAQRHVEVAVPD